MKLSLIGFNLIIDSLYLAFNPFIIPGDPKILDKLDHNSLLEIKGLTVKCFVSDLLRCCMVILSNDYLDS